MARCECIECGRMFSSNSTFENHRAGKYTQTGPDYGRRCLTDEELRARGWSNVTGAWKGKPAEGGMTWRAR